MAFWKNLFRSGSSPEQGKVFYAIMTRGREGSEYLSRLLDTHPEISCAGEIFQEAYFRDHGVAAVRRRLEEKVHALPGKAVGFKLSLGDIMRHPDIIEIVRSENYRFIRLSRNLLDQFTSMKLAIANNSWTADTPDRGIRKISINPTELRSYFENSHFGAMAMEYFTRDRPYLDISFCELFRPENHSVIYKFLNVDVLPLPPVTQKQFPGGQSDRLDDYDELKRHFAGTRWASQFVD